MKKFNIGDRVGIVKDVNKDHDIIYGTVEDLTSKGFVLVKWDSDWYARNHSTPLSPEDLDTEENLEKLAESLEIEFNETAKKIKELIAKSADLINQATALAGDHNLSDFYEEAKPLMKALDDAGWSSSSLNC